MSFSYHVQTGCGAFSPLFSEYRPGRKADHSLPCSAEIKNTWSYTSTSPSLFIKYRNSFDDDDLLGFGAV
jgi:hypothetical protein